MAHHFLGSKHHGGEASKVTDWRKEEKHHKHMEQLGQLGAVAAGAYAMHGKHKAKDPEHAHSHKIKGSPPPSPWAAPALPSTSTTRRKTPRSTAATDTTTSYY
jgi:hypothetical protein